MWLPIPAAALVQRELLEGLREKKVFLLLLTSNVLVFAVFGMGMIAAAGSPAEMAMVAPMAFKALCTIWYGLAVLFIPAMAGASICIEKQQGSFDLLWTTLVRPSGVIAAKMINILSIFLLIVLSNLPVVGVLFFFVGVDWGEFLIGFGLVFLTAVACAAAGLMCSAFFYRTLTAFAASYAATLCFLGVPVWLLVFMSAILLRPFGRPFFLMGAENLFATCCPPYIFARTLAGVPRADMSNAILYQVLFIAVMLLLAWRFLKRPPRPMRIDTRKVIDDSAVLRARRRRFPFYLIDPQRRRAAIADRSNPMCAKEIYSGVLARPTWRIRTFYVSLLLSFPFSLFGAIERFHNVGEELFGVCWYITFFVVMLAPGVMAQALPKEYELGNMDLLRTTLLTPRQILVGKLFSAAITLAPFLLGVLCGLGLMLINMAWSNPWAFLWGAAQGGLLISVNVAWALVLSLWASLYFRRTLPALVAGYITGLFFFAGIPLMFGLMQGFGYGLWRYLGVDRRFFATLIIYTSPLLATFDGSSWIGGSFRWWFLDMLFFAAMSVLLLGVCIRRFKRTHERDR